MNQNAVVTEHTITVNPIYEDTVYINDAVVTHADFVEAVLIDDASNSGNHCMNVKRFIDCIIAILCLSFMLFVLFLFTGGIGYFLTINGGDDPT